MIAVTEPILALDVDSPEWDRVHYYCDRCYPTGCDIAQPLCGLWDDEPVFGVEDPSDDPCAMCLMIEVCPSCGQEFKEETDVDG